MSALCPQHPALPADYDCFRCGRHICEGCTTHTGKGLACPTCVASLSDGRLRNKSIAFGVIAVLVVSIAGYLIGTRDRGGARIKAHALLSSEVDYGESITALNTMAEALEAEPCHASIALDLANELNQHGDYASTLRVVAAHDAPAAGCRPVRKLWWKEMYAHEKLGQWQESVAVGDKLVAARPTDPDYWWWRGKANAKLERREAALVDLRQSMARRPGPYASRILHQLDPCEGAFALLSYVNRKPAATDAETTAMTSLARPECAALRGVGSLELTWNEAEPRPPLDVTIAGTALRATLEPRIGTTVLSQAAATKLGLEPTGPAVTALVGGKVIEVLPTMIDELAVGDARVSRIPAVIAPSLGKLAGVDSDVDLARDVDLAIGQSLLWRFEVLISAEAVNFYELPLAP